MDSKCADPDLQLDVDIMMLDYLVHSALLAVLDETKTTKADAALSMVDDLLVVFNAHHPTPPDLPNLDFRLKLLQFTTLFRRRYIHDPFMPTPTQLHGLRVANSRRSQAWAASRAETYHDQLPPSTDTVMLLDLLPLFMEVCALRANDNPSAYWLSLAAEFMMQAVLDVVRYPSDNEPSDTQIDAILQEAFAWGCPSDISLEDESNSNAKLFWDYDHGLEHARWTEIRSEHLLELKPQDGVDLLAHLGAVCQDHPAKHFDSIVLQLIAGFVASVEQPLLVQLEGDRVAGLSKAETLLLKSKCGLPS